MSALRRLFVEDDGAETVEYALVLGLMAIVAVAGLSGLASDVSSWFTGLGGAIKAVPTTVPVPTP